jgi:hypothetical protein
MPVGAPRWSENWRALAPAGAIPVRVPHGRNRELEARVRSLPTGTSIVLSATAPGARRRCRALARRAGIAIEREYLAVPSATAPGYLIEDARAPIRFFVDRVLAPVVAPPLGLPVAAALDVCRKAVPWRIVRLFTPGRVSVGRCV